MCGLSFSSTMKIRLRASKKANGTHIYVPSIPSSKMYTTRRPAMDMYYLYSLEGRNWICIIYSRGKGEKSENERERKRERRIRIEKDSHGN